MPTSAQNRTAGDGCPYNRLRPTRKIVRLNFKSVAKRYRNFPEGEISLIEDEYHTPQAYITAPKALYH